MTKNLRSDAKLMMNECIFNDRPFCIQTSVSTDVNGNEDNYGNWAHWDCVNYESEPGPVMTDEEWAAKRPECYCNKCDTCTGECVDCPVHNP